VKKTYPYEKRPTDSLSALRTQCEVSGADYSLFWHQEGEGLVVGGGYVSHAYRDALLADGSTFTLAEASLDVVLKVSGDRCVL